MKIIALVKFLPDVDSFEYDHEKNVLIRNNHTLILNADDAKALGFALQMKKADPSIDVEVVTMGPLSVTEQMHDLIRRGADRGTLISDHMFAGSDTYVTARILGKYIRTCEPDLILCGCETLDGGTAHIPAQLAEVLDLPLVAGIVSADTKSLPEKLICQVPWNGELLTAEVFLPAVAAINREGAFRLPFVRYFNIGKDVSDRFRVVSNEELGFLKEETGLAGSKTKVARTRAVEPEAPSQERLVVDDLQEGVEAVYRFLLEKGVLADE